jgi:hypothetical protein
MLPSAPVFLVHETYVGRALLPPVAAARVADGRTPPGLLLDFGAVHLRGVREDAAARGALTPMIADGAVYDTDSKHKVPMAAWVRRAEPSNRSQWDATMRDALAEERSLHVDALSTPGVELPAGGYPTDLERHTDAIRRAWQGRLAADPPWFARVSLHDDWLLNNGMRRFALNLLTDLPDDMGIALHVRFARRDAHQDARVLTPLREMVRVLADDDRRVLLVQSGLVGWLSLAWGAWGFTAGTSQASWFDTREIIRRRAGSRPPARLERYLEPQLLHHVLSADHRLLAAQTGHVQCACTFCGQLARGWTAQAATQHDLYTLAELTQRVAVGDRTARRDAVRSIIEAAQTFWAAWQPTTGLSPRARPTELPVWRSLV